MNSSDGLRLQIVTFFDCIFRLRMVKLVLSADKCLSGTNKRRRKGNRSYGKR